MNYTITQESRIGGRAVNQDRVAWLATDELLLMVVADGMGGHLYGEIAAQLAIDNISQSFREQAKPRLTEPARFLVDTLRRAHLAIVRYAAECRIEPHAAPRTTCIVCVVQDGEAIWAHAGDSRLYLIHGQAQDAADVAQTRDHTVVQQMVDAGSLSRAQAAKHPLRNRVFSCLGGDVSPHIEVSQPVRLRPGDLIALCTDGAWSPLGETLATELRRSPLTTSVPHLLDRAERAAGPDADNLTMIAMRWEAAVGAPIGNTEIEHAVAVLRRRDPQRPTGAS
jgi:serine/threonine protein phosphatase PrpC